MDPSQLSDAQLDAAIAQAQAAQPPAATSSPAAPAAGVVYGPGSNVTGQSVTPGQQAYVTAQGASGGATGPVGTGTNPYFDHAGGQAPAGAAHVTTDGSLVNPNDPGLNLGTMSDADLDAAISSAQQGDAFDKMLAQARSKSGPLDAIANGDVMGLAPVLWGAGDALKAAMGGYPGLSPGEAFSLSSKAKREAEAEYGQAHPLDSTLGNIAGNLMNPLSLVGGELIGQAPSTASAIARSAGLGVTEGALNGYGASGTVGGALTGAAVGGVTGGAVPIVGAAVSPLVRPLARSLRPTPVGESIDLARTALAGTGADYDALPATAQDAITKGVAKGYQPADLAISEAAKSLPVPIPLSRGQITGDPAQQLEENLAFRGARGHSAQLTMQGLKAQQQQALRANVDAIGAQLGGGFPTARGQAGEAVSDALNSAYDAANARTSAAYTAARAAPPAYITGDAASGLADAMKANLSTYDPLRVPSVFRQADILADQTATPAAVAPASATPKVSVGGQDIDLGSLSPAAQEAITGASAATLPAPGQQGVDVGSLFDARARLSNLRASSDPVESSAAGAAIKGLDGSISNAMDSDLFSGNPDAVQAWRDAIGARADFGKTFEANDLVQKLTERQGIGENAQLKVDPHDASNYIFGRSNLGFVGRQNLYRGLGRLKNVLGDGSDAWNRIRGEAFTRIAAQGEGPTEGGTATFSGAKFQNGWNKAKAEDPKLLDALYSPQEQNTISQLAAVSARATKPVTGGDNASNSGAAVARLLRRLPPAMLESIPFIDHFADKLDNAAYGAAARRAAINPKPRYAGPSIGALAGRVAAPLAIAGGLRALGPGSPLQPRQ